MTVEEVYPKVKAIVADVLALEEDEIELKKGLMDDLDAESIDFLDLIFRLEKEFGVKIPRGQIEQEARKAAGDASFEKNGVVTDAGISALRQYMPEVPDAKLKSGLKVAEIPTLFTVESLCLWVIVAKERQSEAN